MNTHTGISLDERPYESFMESDFLPFKAGIRAGAPDTGAAAIRQHEEDR